MRKLFINNLQWGIVASFLTAFIFAGEMVDQSSGLVPSILREVAAVCRDDSTQWMLVVCLAVYLVFFWLLEKKRDSTPHPTLSPSEAESRQSATVPSALR
jgi:hypothetical protein